MTLAPGTPIGPYEILSPLGQGGMGEVYRARDPRLGRDVAVKVLPPEAAEDRERLARFQKEARATGHLNHPNVVAVYDVGEHHGVPFLVTELLDGETLGELLDHGPISARRALAIAQGIADGLGAAHALGIVHRDLKPSNVFLTTSGRVKILDFGLAKSVDHRAHLSDDPSITQLGSIVGTIGYMAPEQIAGELVDGRADVFSLGAILYEMLTGRRAFRGRTPAETLHFILDVEYEPLDELDLPPALTRVVEHCLARDPADRFQSARDLVFALEAGILAPPAAVTTGAIAARPSPREVPPRRRRPSRPALALILGLATGALLTLLVFRRPDGSSDPPMLRHLTLGVNDSAPAISPDGRFVAYVARREGTATIRLREIDGGGEVQLTTGFDDYPRFSPDGSSILFVRREPDRSVLLKMPLPGGEPLVLVRDVHDGEWSPDGSEIALVRHGTDSEGRSASRLVRLVEASGEEEVVVRFDDLVVAQPRWSPDGRRIALVEPGGTRIFVVDLADGSTAPLSRRSPQRSVSSVAWAGPRELVYLEADGERPGVQLSSGRAVRHPIDGDPPVVLFTTPNWGQHLDLSSTGIVVFSAGFSRQDLYECPLDGAGGGRWLTRSRSIDRQPSYAPDGGSIVFSSDRTGQLDLFRLDLGTGDLTRLTDHPAVDWDPCHLPDGRLVWSSNRGGGFGLWTAAADGSGIHPLVPGRFEALDPAPAPDGTWLAWSAMAPGHRGIWRVSADGSSRSLLVNGAADLPRVSPTGDLVTYLASPPGRPTTSVLASVSPSGETGPLRIRLPDQGLGDLVVYGRSAWLPDGTLLLLDRKDEGEEELHRIAVDGSRLDGPAVAPGLRPETFAVSPDGRRVAISHLDLQQSLMLARIEAIEK